LNVTQKEIGEDFWPILPVPICGFSMILDGQQFASYSRLKDGRNENSDNAPEAQKHKTCGVIQESTIVED